MIVDPKNGLRRSTPSQNAKVTFQEIEGQLHNLEYLWPTKEEVTLWWCPVNQVFSARKYNQTYHRLYGSWSAFRGWHSRKARLFSMRPASSAIINEGSQKWKTCFTREDRLFFHQEAGDVLHALGYESSESWTLPE